MSHSLRLRAQVLDDLREAKAWYEDRDPVLGPELEHDFFFTLSKVQREPEWFLPAFENARRALLARFPYAVWFRVEGEIVVIFLLWHTARNPRVLRRLLHERLGESE